MGMEGAGDNCRNRVACCRQCVECAGVRQDAECVVVIRTRRKLPINISLSKNVIRTPELLIPYLNIFSEGIACTISYYSVHFSVFYYSRIIEKHGNVDHLYTLHSGQWCFIMYCSDSDYIESWVMQ